MSRGAADLVRACCQAPCVCVCVWWCCRVTDYERVSLSAGGRAGLLHAASAGDLAVNAAGSPADVAGSTGVHRVFTPPAAPRRPLYLILQKNEQAEQWRYSVPVTFVWAGFEPSTNNVVGSIPILAMVNLLKMFPIYYKCYDASI